jgi:Silencing defective 2 N-terminal ubiquitin domain
MESPNRVNILLRTFSGLALPPTVCISLPSAATTRDLLNQIATGLPASLSAQLILTTTSNRIIRPSSNPISAIVPSASPNYHGQQLPLLLPLTLTSPLPGGKGGFGSQLRAAGGRMSSRRRKNALASDPNAGVGSNRNLDGRRLRTVTEAKRLAEYLATKPEMERREKEERRRRWERVVEGAERREEESRRGVARGKGLSEEWLVEREDASERTREAVRRAMMGGGWRDSVAGSAKAGAGAGANGNANGEGSASASGSGASRNASEEDDSEDEEAMDLDEDEVQTLEKEAAHGDVDAIWVLENKVKKPAAKKEEQQQQRRYVGFDEDDEFMSSEEEEVSARQKEKQKVSH